MACMKTCMNEIYFSSVLGTFYHYAKNIAYIRNEITELLKMETKGEMRI